MEGGSLSEPWVRRRRDVRIEGLGENQLFSILLDERGFRGCHGKAVLQRML
jgi:hypothetical protein